MSRAVLYDEVGGPDVLYLADVPDPFPNVGEVVVEVKAVGLNPFDMKSYRGIAHLSASFPRGLGGDFSGVVTLVGPYALYADGTPVEVGDAVLGWGTGTLCERLLVPAAQVVPKPEDLTWAAAGSLSTPGQTATACLHMLPVGPEDTVLISAAAGSVGYIQAQLARSAGARVIGTASPANHGRLRGIGVEPVEYGPGLIGRLQAAAPDGYTAAFDNHGRETIDAALQLGLSPARICEIVDHQAAVDYGLVSPGRYERRADVLQAIVSRVVSGSLRIPIHQEFPLSEVRAAFEVLERGHLSGKIVVLP